MSVLEHGKRIAELLIQSQDITEKLKAMMPTIPTPMPTYVFKELPKGISQYGCNPHQSDTVPANERKSIWYFKVPPGHIFHVEQIGTNWYPDTYMLFIVDGSILEKWERFVGEINALVDVRRRFIIASNDVRVIAVNNSANDVIYDVIIDGTVYLAEDFYEVAKRGMLF